MSVPHVTSRGTKRESQPPPLWETLQEGNLRLRRQPQPPLVNMFFFFFFSLLSLPPFLIFSLTFYTSQSPCSNQRFNYYSISMISNYRHGVGMGPHVACLFESESAAVRLITTELSVQSFFPATSAKRFCSRQHLLLHAASTHA